ncbi:MAG: hypothetical protein ACKOEN_07715, partial [Betaproteobacteria bacterium]
MHTRSRDLLQGMGRWALGVAVWALVVALFSPAAWAALDIPVGTHSVVFQDGRGRPDRPITVHTHRPSRCVAACPILFVMHGNTRNAAAYRDHWVPWADTLGLMVLAPEFNRRDWPGSRSYNQGDMAAQSDPAMWSYSVVEHLFDAVRTTQAHYLIFGHSAGAQFVHRLLMALPNNRASMAMIANAGTQQGVGPGVGRTALTPFGQGVPTGVGTHRQPGPVVRQGHQKAVDKLRPRRVAKDEVVRLGGSHRIKQMLHHRVGPPRRIGLRG